MARPGYISLPIVVVLVMVLYLYYATVFVVIEGWLGLTTASGIANLVVFSYFSLGAVVMYMMSALTDPGHVPDDYVPDIEDPESPVHEVKRKGGDLRFCQKCSHHKPPRAHHCRVCKRCVLRMDHHCVWINNCVGHGNYKVFLVFVLYAVIACIHSMVLLLCGVLNGQHRDQQNGGSYKASYIISSVLVAPLTVALCVLLGWQIYLVLLNKTTIEYHEGVRAMLLAERVGNIYRHPYDLGIYENLVSVFGPNVFCWFCPVMLRHGSGVRFRTSYDHRFPAA